MLHLHGLIMSLWFGLFVVQTRLVAVAGWTSTASSGCSGRSSPWRCWWSAR